MKRTVQECATLKEYREQVLRMPQMEVARRAKCTQAWISLLERTGHQPRLWNLEKLLKAYELEDEQLVRLLTGSCRAAAIQKPAEEDFPLTKFQQAEAPAPEAYKQEFQQQVFRRLGS